jgi:hypothetical protein
MIHNNNNNDCRSKVSRQSKRDILFGIYNYDDATALYRWLRSLREAGATCDVVVFTHRAHRALHRVCQRYGCSVLEYFSSLTNHSIVNEVMSRPYMQALRNNFTPELIKNYKFTFMYCYLLEFGHLYNRAGFMDIRDIFFQGDPFSRALCVGLTAFTETAALLVENREYIYKDHYPLHCDTQWEKFKKLPPLNSGGFMADISTMKKIVQLSDEILQKCGPGFDQGTFNEIVYLNMLNVEVATYTSEYSPVAMICNSLSIGVSAIDTVLNDAMVMYDVVHQFDRFEELMKIYQKRWPIDVSNFHK